MHLQIYQRCVKIPRDMITTLANWGVFYFRLILLFESKQYSYHWALLILTYLIFCNFSDTWVGGNNRIYDVFLFFLFKGSFTIHTVRRWLRQNSFSRDHSHWHPLNASWDEVVFVVAPREHTHIYPMTIYQWNLLFESIAVPVVVAPCERAFIIHQSNKRLYCGPV